MLGCVPGHLTLEKEACRFRWIATLSIVDTGHSNLALLDLLCVYFTVTQTYATHTTNALGDLDSVGV